jgi:CBS domain-containing protein
VKVRDLMTEAPVAVAPDTEIVEAARLMEEYGIGALPVCDADRVVGIVTDRDIVLRHVAQSLPSHRVSSIMTPYPYIVGPDEPLERAEDLLAEHRVRRLPVCERGKLVGVLSRTDLDRRDERALRAGRRQEDETPTRYLHLPGLS